MWVGGRRAEELTLERNFNAQYKAEQKEERDGGRMSQIKLSGR